MAATVAVAVGRLGRRLAGECAAFLAQAGQRVVLAQNADDGAALARFGHERGWDAGGVPRNAKARLLQHRDVQLGRFVLGVTQFGQAPDAVAQVGVTVAARVDERRKFPVIRRA
ncbi:hypothetical protein G6F59_018153 [Rhizopus arrhizus]|nr:hypothetical protein G6F59_018153 [Rhizopus arrhizus]